VCAMCGTHKRYRLNGLSYCPHCDQMINCAGPTECHGCQTARSYDGVGPGRPNKPRP